MCFVHFALQCIVTAHHSAFPLKYTWINSMQGVVNIASRKWRAACWCKLTLYKAGVGALPCYWACVGFVWISHLFSCRYWEVIHSQFSKITTKTWSQISAWLLTVQKHTLCGYIRRLPSSQESASKENKTPFTPDSFVISSSKMPISQNFMYFMTVHVWALGYLYQAWCLKCFMSYFLGRCGCVWSHRLQ